MFSSKIVAPLLLPQHLPAPDPQTTGATSGRSLGTLRSTTTAAAGGGLSHLETSLGTGAEDFLVAPGSSFQKKYKLAQSKLGGGWYPLLNTGRQHGVASATLSSEGASGSLSRRSSSTSSSSVSSSTDREHYHSQQHNHSYGSNPYSILRILGSEAGHRFIRQQYIAQIIPVGDVREMSRIHWTSLFALEKTHLPVDYYKEKECTILGLRQININRDHRHRIVKWMCEACGLFKWCSQTFFASAHAWDIYVTTVLHEISSSDLAKLSASSLYFGAQLIESAADENVRTFEEFRDMCPEVESSSAIRLVQAHLVDTLQGASLMRRTPVDFLLLFLAALQVGPQPCPRIFEALLQQDLLLLIWDLVIAVSLTIYANGLILDGIPGSYWVAGTLLRGLEFACPVLKTDMHARRLLFQCVLHMSPSTLKVYQATVIDPLIKSVWRSLNDEREAGPLSSSAARAPQKPYDVIRHYQPPSFSRWAVTFPSNRLVKELSTRLRALVFDTNTPPTSSLGTSTTAASASPSSQTVSAMKTASGRDRACWGVGRSLTDKAPSSLNSSAERQKGEA